MEGEDTAHLLIEFDDGSTGEVNTSWAFDQPAGLHSFYVIGEKGQLYGEGNFLGYKVSGFSESTRNYVWKNPFIVEVSHFLDVIDGKAQPLQTIDDAYQVMRVIDAAYRSVESGKAEGLRGR
ncbi:Gfo/Idh/MocA family oxidoreductase [Tardisphaera saccharovorans]